MRSKNGTNKTKKTSGKPQSLAIARRGVRTGRDFANLMSAVMADLIEGTIGPGVANAACNAGGKLLKVVELQIRYGKAIPETGEKLLILATDEALSGSEKLQ